MYEKLTYLTILEQAKPMLCLDISVRSTGWVLWDGKQVYYGTYTLETDNSRKRRLEFGNLIEGLLKQHKVDLIVLEDVIAGCNFKTTRILTELNIMAEMLMDFGRIPDVPVYRKDNKQWKSDLRQLSQAQTEVKGVDDKAMIRYHLGTLGFNPDVPQDVYDAMGIGLSYVYGEHKGTNQNSANVKVHKLHIDLSKGYKKKQYSNKEEMLKAVEQTIKRARKPRQYRYIEYDNRYKNLTVQFRELIESEGTDEHIYCIHAPLNKVGSMFITAGFDLSADDVYFTAIL